MEKPTEKQVERADTIFVDDDQHPQKPVPIVEKIDYSGAHEKTDPREIALVKKLDLWIMVGPLLASWPNDLLTKCSPCSSLCTSSTTSTATPLHSPGLTIWRRT
jgi:hypothetical protein